MKTPGFRALVWLVMAVSCGSAKTYEMRGQVLGVNRDKLEILVKHEEIKGLMPAMTMPWKVRTANMLDTLEAGDLITSEIAVDNSHAIVTKITKTGTAKPDVPPPAPSPHGAKYLMPGDEVPNQVFVDEEGRQRDFNAIRADRPIAITFIYTKCPIPTVCPAMDRQFAEAQALIRKKGLTGRAALLSVSFDPDHDTPAVLKAHARKLDSDPRVWNFVTGERAAIDRFATNMLVTLVRGQAANPEEIGHTLRTTVVGRDGKIVKSYSGADWTAADLVTELERLL